ncbi:MAG: hypothetical protein ACTSUE_03235 [Promethearchaeota archaeon]
MYKIQESIAPGDTYRDPEWESGLTMVIKRTYFINDKLSLWLSDGMKDYDLKIESGGDTFVVVDGKPLATCMHVILHLDETMIDATKDAKDMDEIIRIYKRLRAPSTDSPQGGMQKFRGVQITPEEEFQAHCSNIQAWYEHGYDTRLMDSRLAFRILGALFEAGDPTAERVLRREIQDRLSSGSLNSLYAMPSVFLKTLNKQEWNEIFNSLPTEKEIIAYAKRILASKDKGFRAKVPEWVVEMVDSYPNQYFVHLKDGSKKRILVGPDFNVALPFFDLSQFDFRHGPYNDIIRIKIGNRHLKEPGVDALLIADARFVLNQVGTPETVKEIEINKCGLQTLSSLNHFTNLEKLTIEENLGLKEIPRLDGLKRLKVIRLNRINISNLLWLGDLPALEDLSINSLSEFSLDGISHLKSLRKLRIIHWKPGYIRGRPFPPNLETLWFDQTLGFFLHIELSSITSIPALKLFLLDKKLEKTELESLKEKFSRAEFEYSYKFRHRFERK